MGGIKSHFGRSSIGNWIVLSLAVGIPVAAALVGSFFLGQQVFTLQGSQNEVAKMQEVRSQTRLLTDNIWTGIEGVKNHAQAYWLTRSQIGNRAVLDTQILAYARLEQTAGAGGQPTTIVKEVVKNPTWTRQVLANLNGSIQTASRGISMRSVHQSGASIVKIPKNPGDSGEFIGIVFLPSAANTNLVMAVVDPEQVFTSFSRWVTRREAGNLRGYLIGADGKVLVHSERVYSGSDFSNSQIYQHALESLFHNQRASGVGTFTAVDLRSVLTSYARVGSLPFAVVVERVVRPMGSTLLRQFMIPAMFLGSLVLILSLLSVATVRMIMAGRKNGVVKIKVPELEPLLARVSELGNEREEINHLKDQLQAALARFGHTEPNHRSPDHSPNETDHVSRDFDTSKSATEPTPEKEN